MGPTEPTLFAHIFGVCTMLIVFCCLLQGTGFFEYALAYREKRQLAKTFTPPKQTETATQMTSVVTTEVEVDEEPQRLAA